MASHIGRYDTENVTATSTNTKHASNIPCQPSTSARRVLGNVSPNVRKPASISIASANKPLTGSPLKRSFGASTAGGDGHTYLKRRKLSDDEFVDSSGGPKEQYTDGGQDLVHGGKAAKFQAFLQPDETDPSLVLAVDASSPTEPNTPSDRHSPQPPDDSSTERKSFSSLINYDPSSQTSTIAPSHRVSHAEMLRLRLRMAMYKVRTNQTHMSFHELQESEPNRAQPTRSNDAVQMAVSALRDQSQLTSAPTTLGPIPRLVPGPLLQPTEHHGSHVARQPAADTFATPTASPNRLPTVPQWRMASPLRNGVQLSATPDRLRDHVGEQELTSSAVKGRVAEGLLGLRNAI